MAKKLNPRRRPMNQAEVERAKDKTTIMAVRTAMAIFFTVLKDKHDAPMEDLQQLWEEVNDLSDSIRQGYVSVPDLIRVLKEEYEIEI